MKAPFPHGLVLVLAFAQLVAWGVFYYAFAVLMVPIGADLGWSKTALSGALSLGLATNGLTAYAVGRWIDRYGGRRLMMAGATVGALLLLLWSGIDQLWQLYAIWVGIGMVSATLLYESAFAVVTRALPQDYRRAILYITLLGGLASTVFIPLTQFLADSLGWRQSLIALSAIVWPICFGIPYLFLRDRERLADLPLEQAQTAHDAPVRHALSQATFWFLAVSFVSYALFYTSLLFHLVPMLAEKGFGAGAAVLIYSCIGPAQVAGRAIMLALERRFSVTLAGVLGTLLPMIGLLALAVATPESGLAFLFAIAFGAGMGIKTIVQATATPEFIGRAGYGAIQGAIMMPVYAAQALAPIAAAAIWQFAGGYDAVRLVLFVVAGLAVLAFLAAAWKAPRRRAK